MKDVIHHGLCLTSSFLTLLKVATSDFVTNSCGETWDSSCEKSWVPVHNQWVPVKKKVLVLDGKCLGLSVSRQSIWRQTPKLFIIHSLPKKEITRTGYSTTKIFKSISHSLHPTGRIPWIILHLWEFLCIGKAGCKVTKSGSHFVIYPTEKCKPIVRSENITSTSAWLLLDKQVINKAYKTRFFKKRF